MERKEYLQQYYQEHKEQYRESQKRYAGTVKGKDSQRQRNARWRTKADYQQYMKEYMRRYRQKKALEKE